MNPIPTDLHWKEIFENIDCPCFLLQSADGVSFSTTFSNKAYADLSGVSQSELKGEIPDQNYFFEGLQGLQLLDHLKRVWK
jgi:PAS domain-containing protein